MSAVDVKSNDDAVRDELYQLLKVAKPELLSQCDDLLAKARKRGKEDVFLTDMRKRAAKIKAKDKTEPADDKSQRAESQSPTPVQDNNSEKVQLLSRIRELLSNKSSKLESFEKILSKIDGTEKELPRLRDFLSKLEVEATNRNAREKASREAQEERDKVKKAIEKKVEDIQKESEQSARQAQEDLQLAQEERLRAEAELKRIQEDNKKFEESKQSPRSTKASSRSSSTSSSSSNTKKEKQEKERKAEEKKQQEKEAAEKSKEEEKLAKELAKEEEEKKKKEEEAMAKEKKENEAAEKLAKEEKERVEEEAARLAKEKEENEAVEKLAKEEKERKELKEKEAKLAQEKEKTEREASEKAAKEDKERKEKEDRELKEKEKRDQEESEKAAKLKEEAEKREKAKKEQEEAEKAAKLKKETEQKEQREKEEAAKLKETERQEQAKREEREEAEKASKLKKEKEKKEQDAKEASKLEETKKREEEEKVADQKRKENEKKEKEEAKKAAKLKEEEKALQEERERKQKEKEQESKDKELKATEERKEKEEADHKEKKESKKKLKRPDASEYPQASKTTAEAELSAGRWKSKTCKKTSRIFYFNVNTRESTWDLDKWLREAAAKEVDEKDREKEKLVTLEITEISDEEPITAFKKLRIKKRMSIDHMLPRKGSLTHTDDDVLVSPVSVSSLRKLQSRSSSPFSSRKVSIDSIPQVANNAAGDSGSRSPTPTRSAQSPNSTQLEDSESHHLATLPASDSTLRQALDQNPTPPDSHLLSATILDRQELIRLFNKYRPEDLDSLDLILIRRCISETALLEEMRLKYENPNKDRAIPSSTRILHNNQNIQHYEQLSVNEGMCAGAHSEYVPSAEGASICRILKTMYRRYNPTLVDYLNKIVSYFPKEESALLAMVRQKYVPLAVEADKREVTILSENHSIQDVDQLLYDWQGREDQLVLELRHRYSLEVPKRQDGSLPDFPSRTYSSIYVVVDICYRSASLHHIRKVYFSKLRVFAGRQQQANFRSIQSNREKLLREKEKKIRIGGQLSLMRAVSENTVYFRFVNGFFFSPSLFFCF